MQAERDKLDLCYIEAARLRSPAGRLDTVEIRDMEDRAVGCLDGVLVDPVQRRLRYFVVEPLDRRQSRQYLLPTDWPAQVAADNGALRIEMADDLTDCDEFQAESVRTYSEDDFLAALFRRSA